MTEATAYSTAVSVPGERAFERVFKERALPEEIPEALIGSSTGSRYMVPASYRTSFESAKMAAATTAGLADTLSPVSILGTTQRAWWKTKMSSATTTWKLWGNEVSLLRMGLNGTNAIATLVALNSVSTLVTNITNTVSGYSVSVEVASAIIAAVTAGASSANAQAGAVAIATADAVDNVRDFVVAAHQEVLAVIQACRPSVVGGALRFAQGDGDGLHVGIGGQNFGRERPVGIVIEFARVNVHAGFDSEGGLAILLVGDHHIHELHQLAHHFAGLLAGLEDLQQVGGLHAAGFAPVLVVVDHLRGAGRALHLVGEGGREASGGVDGDLGRVAGLVQQNEKKNCAGEYEYEFLNGPPM